MINEEAIDKLNKQPNKSQYIEDLILSGPTEQSNPVEDYIIQSLDYIKEKIGVDSFKVHSSAVQKVSIPPVRPLRTTGTIINEIKELEKYRDEQLQYCQDPEEIQRIGSNYKEQTDTLWAEYHELKALDEQ